MPELPCWQRLQRPPHTGGSGSFCAALLSAYASVVNCMRGVPCQPLDAPSLAAPPQTLLSLPICLQLFVEYYQKQGVVPEGEWDAFMAVLRTQLPTTFRINGMGKFAQDLRDKLETDFLRTFSEGAVKVWLGTARDSALHSRHGTSDQARELFPARSFGC